MLGLAHDTALEVIESHPGHGSLGRAETLFHQLLFVLLQFHYDAIQLGVLFLVVLLQLLEVQGVLLH